MDVSLTIRSVTKLAIKFAQKYKIESYLRAAGRGGDIRTKKENGLKEKALFLTEIKNCSLRFRM